jgi:hypothetical protein
MSARPNKERARLSFEDGYWYSGKQYVFLRNEHNGGVLLGEAVTADTARRQAIRKLRKFLKELESRA